MATSKKLIIRQMEEKDLERVYAISKTTLLDIWTFDDYRRELFENQFATMLVLTYDDVVIGFIDFWVTYNSATIAQIAVHESLHHKGLGSILLSDMINRLSALDDVEVVTLEVRTHNEAAINFYKKHGFEISVTKKKYYKNGDDAYYMLRNIK